MFGFFNKKNSTETKIAAVLEQIMLADKPLATFVEKQSVANQVLNLQVRIKQTQMQALEVCHQQLQQQLHGLGIVQVDINAVVDNADVGMVQTHQPDNTANAADNHASDKPPAKAAPKQSELTPHPRIKHIIAIASGKGGVGKSTTTVNLALALQALGKRVGVLDADIYGPSIPAMLGVAGSKPMVENDQFVPIDAQGLAVLSIGNLLDSEQTPVAWRGIKATGALMQLYTQTNWPMLDYLLIDMPPGTGDIQLTLAQRILLTGAVIVTTPQHIALLDAQKGVAMFQKTDIAILGIVENMALHTCSNCGHSEAIFGAGGGDEMARRYGVPLLGQLPLDGNIRAFMDDGKIDSLQQADFAQHYLEIAKKIDEAVAKQPKKTSDRFF